VKHFVAVAERLIRSGYCPVSNKHFMLSRIDRPDWREHMALKHCGGRDEEDPFWKAMEWVAMLGEQGAADHYRRCYSKDRITVSPEVYGRVKHGNSNRRNRGRPWEFVEKLPSNPRALDL
jgi:hypothetical protein